MRIGSYKIVSGSTQNLRDTHDFIESLNVLPDLLPPGFSQFFSESSGLIVTRAPGRLDVMGGIADYSGSLVLQLPIARATHAALQRNASRLLRIVSLSTTSSADTRVFEMPLLELFDSGRAIGYDDARHRFESDPENHWAAYVVGAFLVLARERGFRFTGGASVLVQSSVPEGKGVSSSAALEVACMQAVVSAYGVEITSQELALLCQKVENLVAGAPCGVMDQMTSACGEANRLLELLCQPCDLKSNLPLPDDLELWGIDSGVRHSVSASDYTTVRTAAFMGYRIIAELARLNVQSSESGKVWVDDPAWYGYLANITPAEFEREYSARTPQQMSGKEFLDRYGGITDPVTFVRPEVDYPIWRATKHPIYENSRVESFATMLKNWEGGDQAQSLGKLMLQSHESYSECGLGSADTDLLVDLVGDEAHEFLYGARITGGGSGGTVAVLGRRGQINAVAGVAERYRVRTGYRPIIFSGSSPGANGFQHLRVIRS